MPHCFQVLTDKCWSEKQDPLNLLGGIFSSSSFQTVTQWCVNLHFHAHPRVGLEQKIYQQSIVLPAKPYIPLLSENIIMFYFALCQMTLSDYHFLKRKTWDIQFCAIGKQATSKNFQINVLHVILYTEWVTALISNIEPEAITVKVASELYIFIELHHIVQKNRAQLVEQILCNQSVGHWWGTTYSPSQSNSILQSFKDLPCNRI